MELNSEIFNQFFYNLIISLGIPLLVLLVSGFCLAFVQAVTQIQDQILSFVPKTGILCAVVFWGGSASIQKSVEFLVQIFQLIRTIK